MDINRVSQSMNHAQLRQQIDVSVTKMTMDMAQMQSDQLIQLMEKSVTPHLGGTIDMRI